MLERTIQSLIMQSINKSGRAIVVRNNVGLIAGADGRRHRVGLGIGSADLVGILLGSGRVFCIEVKKPGGPGPTTEQRAWARALRARGGFCTVCRSVPEALAALERAMRGESQ